MQKLCTCGETMNIRLCTIIYSNKVEIENVPVFSCAKCRRSEVYSGVKPDLTKLIGKLGHEPEKKQLYFNEMNELAHLMYKASNKDGTGGASAEEIVEERINQLLDLLLLAQSLGDQKWGEDIRGRLAQIANLAFTTYSLFPKQGAQ